MRTPNKLEISLNNLNAHVLADQTEEESIELKYPKSLQSSRINVPLNKFLKRSVDLLLGGTLTIILLPVLVPITAILIKLDSSGPVFFLQKRTGLNGKSFLCYKFRTMVVNKQADRLEVQPEDKRITKVGKYLRHYHLDELPQLINVLIGHMSLVGPRPLMLRHTVIYSRLIKNYHKRHLVKPGLTGLAQMRGYHGIICTKEDLIKRTGSDIEYIENWSVARDIYIFFNTLVQITKKL